MESKTLANNYKPHAVVIPSITQGHITPMLKLAKALHQKGLHITFVNTESNHNRLLGIRGPNFLNGLPPSFQFETIIDCHPIPELCEATQKKSLSYLLAKLKDTNNVPPVTCIVADGFVPFAISAAKEEEIPIVLFFTISACSFMCFKQFPTDLINPPKDGSYLANGDSDRVVNGIPGMKNVRVRDLPSFVRTSNPNNYLFHFCQQATIRASKASAVIFHTFDALEQEVLNALSPMFSNVYTIGPLQLLLNRIEENDDLKSIGSNLWKEDIECLHWLDSKKPNSVIFVSFGSLTVITKEQFIELGMGLVKSGHQFLWIIRPDMVTGDSSVKLPVEFYDEIKDRGLIGSWCPQEEVLNHPSIGGFLTHCGWASTLESISSGVPMLCWPYFGDQQTNCRYTCSEWAIGEEIDRDINRDNVAKLVKELMEGENGKKMKNKAMEWKKLAEEAAGPSGSSSMNLDKLVKEILLL